MCPPMTTISSGRSRPRSSPTTLRDRAQTASTGADDALTLRLARAAVATARAAGDLIEAQLTAYGLPSQQTRASEILAAAFETIEAVSTDVAGATDADVATAITIAQQLYQSAYDLYNAGTYAQAAKTAQVAVRVARTGALFNIIPILARDRLALHPDRIGFGLALASIVGLALAYPAGVFVDRYGRKIIIVPATVLSGLSLLVFLLAPTYAWFLVGCAAWSVAMGISGAAPAAYAADTAPGGMNAAALSTYRMLADLGYVVGPIVLGLVADLAGVDTALIATDQSYVEPLTQLLERRIARRR